MLLTVCNCRQVISTACPPYTEYTQDFKDNLKRDLKENKSYFINQVVIDYFNLNENIKICNGIK